MEQDPSAVNAETNLLILDLDGTVRSPLSNHKFIQRPGDQQIIKGAEGAIAYFAATGWKIVGVTNQGGVASGKKSLQSCIKEQQYTLDLLPEIEEVYFCPDFEGKKCFCVTSSDVINYSQHPESGKFRKPNPGMLNLAIQKHLPDKVLMIGDRSDDRNAAKAAGIKFQQAESWRQTYGDTDV
ncbi:HAD-IIIA family hydrolase [Coleofasciculus sp. FACHB-129]|uniref:HAD-IIIA family hydrolase n=1 Tax=Cyanophyceae TaxID=3028117 RepID=UPI0016847CE6|nr:HAD-IIIA family hydrolase [Coleofasciculus sp. FACHB-129]MBD1898053.1 HAD-IIIA family hydrolase [Coleofasciculus sp. FACHB-129]